MGNKLKEAIIDNILKPHLENYMDQVKAKVISYDHTINQASVIFNSPNGQGHITLVNVPVQLGSGGVHSAGPFSGDDVWITFHNGDIKKPTIIALADDDHDNNTRGTRQVHSRKGAYVPDSICSRGGW